MTNCLMYFYCVNHLFLSKVQTVLRYVVSAIKIRSLVFHFKINTDTHDQASYILRIWNTKVQVLSQVNSHFQANFDLLLQFVIYNLNKLTIYRFLGPKSLKIWLPVQRYIALLTVVQIVIFYIHLSDPRHT